MKFFNRLTGQITNQLSHSILLGQWQVLKSNQESIILNKFALYTEQREYIFGDSSGRWSLESETNFQEGRFPRSQMPSELVFESIVFFDTHFQQLVKTQASWNKWINTPPLVHNINEKIRLQPLEKFTEKVWGHLETVCHRPRTYLKMETEKLPVSRVQRISRNAVEYLAGHPEDWESIHFRSVKPKQLLGLVREDLFDIYENQVTARLIDHLLEYICYRINEIQILQREIQNVLDFSENAHNNYWINRQRICTLWADFLKADIGWLELEETFRKLTQLKFKLSGLLGTTLYENIPRNKLVKNTLKRTNIFVNDQHYRYIDSLWREWSFWKRQVTRNSQEFFQENQKLFRGLEAFCFLLICRALTGNGSSEDKGLGFCLLNSKMIDKYHTPFQFQSRKGKVSITWQENGCFLVNALDFQLEKNLLFIPLLANLSGNNDAEEITNLLNELKKI